nr:putative ribonuclease H-like domain-containing protein [Tanacetum cinerariifolium]
QSKNTASTTKAEYVATANCYGQVLWIQNQMLDYGFNFLNTKIYIDNENETVYKEWEDIMERAATTVSSLEAERDNGNINMTQSMATLNEPLPQGTGPDGNVKLISEASIRRLLKLEDSDGISTLTNTKIFEQLALIGQEDQPEDQLGVMSAAKILADATKVYTYSRRRRAVSTGRGEVSTASRIISFAEEIVSTAGVSIPVSTAGMVQESTSLPRATKDKGKAIMTESEPK